MFVIFGASGNAGRAAANRLRQSGHAVRAVVRDKCSVTDLASLGCEVVDADLDDPASIERAFDGAHAVQIVCPVVAAHPQPLQAMRHSIDVLADALARTQAPHVLAISDYGAQLTEGTGITLVFNYLERRLEQLPAALTLLRSAEHMQNWARVARMAAATGVLPSFHDPVTKRFPTIAAQDVGHIAADLLRAAPTQGARRVVHAEGPRRISTQDVAVALSEVSGRAIVAEVPPRAQWESLLGRAGVGGAYARLVVDLYDAHNEGRIDVEKGVGELRVGTTALIDVLRAVLGARGA